MASPWERALLNPESPGTVDDLDLLQSRVHSFAPAQQVAALLDCVVEHFTLERDQPLLAGRGLEDRLYVLGEGFAFDFSILPAGKRHIFDFYGPGAICNWTRPEREDTPENLLVKARSEVLVLDRAQVGEVLAGNRDLADALHEHEIRRAMRLSQRVRALISLPAKACLRILLLDIEDEYGASGQPREWLPLPLTQEEIGDLIGSTSVHVSRTMAALEKDGEVERRATNFRLHAIEELRARMSYRRFADPIHEVRSHPTG